MPRRRLERVERRDTSGLNGTYASVAAIQRWKAAQLGWTALRPRPARLIPAELESTYVTGGERHRVFIDPA